MVSGKEWRSRLKTDFRFSKQELIGLIAAIVVTGFIFSFRDWGGDQFELATGIGNFVTMVIIAAITLFFRISCQKAYGLTEAHRAEFKIWWTGLLISLVIVFITLGKVPLILAGGSAVAFMVRQRLGEFRYGFSYWVNGMIAYWGPMANLILAILFGVGNYFVPESYFFSRGMMLNLIMAFASFIPIPQLDGLQIFMGHRTLYFAGVLLVFLATILLLSQTAIGLIVSIVCGLVYTLIYMLISSEV